MRPTALFISNIRWDFVWQRHQTLASLFARDYDVVFCEIPGTRRPRLRDLACVWDKLRRFRSGPVPGDPAPSGMRVVRPPVLPAAYTSLCRLNALRLERWLQHEARLREGVDLIVNYSAARTALQLIDRVPHKKLIYDCTDDWLAVSGIPKFLPKDEQQILLRADLTLVPSRTLLERKQSQAKRCVRLPHGALVERFLVPMRPLHGLEDLVLLYYGHLHRQHLDFELIETIARLRPGWRLRLVGPVKTPHVFPANVTLVGQVPHANLRHEVSRADVILLPYAINRYTEAVMPAKTYECLATGRPVVAARLPELISEFQDVIAFPGTTEDWVPAIENQVRLDNESARAARIALARANTWEQRYERILELLNSN